MRRLLWSLALALAMIWAAAPLLAQPNGSKQDRQKALRLYNKGSKKYDLGRWKEAIDLFSAAYETYPAPEFLYNIAQAYRKDGDCKQSLFFYERYLANKTDASNRVQVEEIITELKQECGKVIDPVITKQENDPPPPEDDPQDDPAPDKGDDEADAPQDDEEYDARYDADLPPVRHLVVSVAAGPGFASMGDIDLPVLLAFAGGLAYPLQVNGVGIELGAMLSYSPVPWTNDAMDLEGTASFLGLMGNVGLTYPLGGGFAARGDVGGGVLVFGGLDTPNTPFLEADQVTDGALSMLQVRAGLGLEYQLQGGLLFSAQPVYSFSPVSDLRDDISSIQRFEILLGAGYRL